MDSQVADVALQVAEQAGISIIIAFLIYNLQPRYHLVVAVEGSVERVSIIHSYRRPVVVGEGNVRVQLDGAVLKAFLVGVELLVAFAAFLVDGAVIRDVCDPGEAEGGLDGVEGVVIGYLDICGRPVGTDGDIGKLVLPISVINLAFRLGGWGKEEEGEEEDEGERGCFHDVV